MSRPSRLSRLPVEKLSRTRTSSPRSTSAATRFEPMNPAPPVTRTFTSPIFPERRPKSSARLRRPVRSPARSCRPEEPDDGRLAQSAQGEHYRRQEDSDEEQKAHDAEVGERLDVEVLDAVAAIRRGKRQVRLL